MYAMVTKFFRIKHRGRLEGFLLDGVESIHSRHGTPPDKVVPEPEWPERERIQHVRMSQEPWNVSPDATEALGEYGATMPERFWVRFRHIRRRT
jgi:hypothetical protein